MVSYVDHIYHVLLEESKFFDALYEDYIINLVGHTGLDALRNNKLVETCGVVNGKQLYTVVSKETTDMFE